MNKPLSPQELDRINQKREEHVKYFDMIKPAKHWKDKINATIDADDFDKCVDACMYFTGTELRIYASLGGKYKVKSVGYWGGPCN